MNPQQATALRLDITRALHACAAGPLAARAAALLGALGYHSDKALALAPNTFAGFRDAFLDGQPFNEDKALADQWKSVDLLFQYTDAEVKASGQMALDVFADPRFNPSTYQSFVFFAVDLAGDSYTRTQLAQATREINRPFPMPAIVVFRHGPTLTLAVVDRRPNKRDDTRDVLEKVTLIKDIRLAPSEKPHRAHVEILADLALDPLTQSHTVTNFDALHAAWRKTLDTAALNKKFYKELADWYFWAREHVTFPPQAGVTAEVNHATSVIRLITRLMFTWFLKERGLVPDELFDDRALPGLLKAPDLTGTGSAYYKAVLQNLFFATLNTEMDDPAHPRRFRGRNKSGGSDGHYGIASVMRYDDSFRDTEAALALFAPIPFLNGGLFECLDQNAKGSPRVLVDGFSDRDDNPLSVPNFLFFADARDVDLNAVYGTTGKTTKVRGLLHILNSYKFTVAENTPIEEEIALDPELLGRVFENLLASYNPETGATARKQTGSFYTPREIVNYMVDEALIASLETALIPTREAAINTEGAASGAPTSDPSDSPLPLAGEGRGVGVRLRHLFAYNPDPPDFTPAEVNALITAIDALKILDPACGSGAFPMGILQKLVFVLGKLDPHNAKWRDRQIEKAELIDDPTARDHAVADIVQAFDKNDLDYGRKLYLISNGIYGVDIQPIAMQIAKLRFFISLIIDQRIDDSAKNRGVRALPNLETKFVAANTLLGIERPAQTTLADPEIERKQAELARVRARFFSARTPKTKADCKEEDKKLRAELSALLEGNGMPHATALRLAGWDPYDQSQSADFFDPEWMYGVDHGFDITIANPPYGVQFDKMTLENLRQRYETIWQRPESYVLFIEKSVKCLRNNGIISFITPDTYLNLGFTQNLRRFLLANTKMLEVVLLPAKVFESATVDTSLLFARKLPLTKGYHDALVSVRIFDKRRTDVLLDRADHQFNASTASWAKMDAFNIKANDTDKALLGRTLSHVALSQYADIFSGIKAYEVGKGTPPQTSETRETKPFTSKTQRSNDWQPFFDGKHIGRYKLLWDHNNWIKYGAWLAAPRNASIFRGEKLLIRKIVGKTLVGTYVPDTSYCNTLLFVLTLKPNSGINYCYLLGILNSKFVGWYFRKQFQISADDTFPQIMARDILQIPIPKVPTSHQDEIAQLVDSLIATKDADEAQRVEISSRIDKAVYDLYGFSPDEIVTIENELDMISGS